MPQGEDSACYVVVALWCVVNAATIERDEISECVEVIEIMELAVDGRNARLSLATVPLPLK